MRRKLFFIILILSSPHLSASALSPDSAELSLVSPVEFINYTGQTPRQNTDEKFRGIGAGLASGLLKEKRVPSDRYSVQRFHDSSQPEKLSADILSISPRAKVNHIRAIRKILSGYCSLAYSLSRKESDTLAVALTWYNALHRADTDYFTGRYKTVVIAGLSGKSA
ncbi:MAG: P83/100 family protein, partial [Spirochaetota bacterium]